MNIFLILCIILIMIIVVLFYVIFNLIKRNESLEQLHLDSIDRYDVSIKKIQDTIDLMMLIDSRGYFQADDEVGVGFNMLKDTIVDLSNSLNTLNQNVSDE